MQTTQNRKLSTKLCKSETQDVKAVTAKHAQKNL